MRGAAAVEARNRKIIASVAPNAITAIAVTSGAPGQQAAEIRIASPKPIEVSPLSAPDRDLANEYMQDTSQQDGEENWATFPL